MPDDSPCPETARANDRQTVGIGGPPPTDRDLIAAVRSGTPDQRRTAARRVPVSPRLAEALVETGDPEAVAALLANRSAVMCERLLLECLDRLADDEGVQRAMIGRDRLPPAVAQRLVALVSGRLSAELLARHALPPLPEGEHGELGPDRPGWWSQHIEGLFR
ncbi:MAG: DUF2336 domain-containing protein [Planctomycetota bacterium]|jgi:uncharacterized protein (DUF2336 family)